MQRRVLGYSLEAFSELVASALEGICLSQMGIVKAGRCFLVDSEITLPRTSTAPSRPVARPMADTGSMSCLSVADDVEGVCNQTCIPSAHVSYVCHLPLNTMKMLSFAGNC